MKRLRPKRPTSPAEAMPAERQEGEKFYQWTVQFEVDAVWVADGFDLTDARAVMMLAGDLSFANADTELRAKVLSRPDRAEILREQGVPEADIPGRIAREAEEAKAEKARETMTRERTMRKANRTTPEATIAWCPAKLVSIDEMLDDGRTRWGGKTLDEVRTEYPQAELITITEAHRRTNDKHREAPQRITGERWDWLLNCLPPEQWTRKSGAESFKVSERICADITQICVALGAEPSREFWDLKDHYNMPHADAVELVRSRRAVIMTENAGDVIDVIAEAIRALPAAWENTGKPAPNGADYIIRHLSRDANFVTLEALKASPERWSQYAESLVNMLEDVQAAFPDEWFAEKYNTPRELLERMEKVKRRARGWQDEPKPAEG